jgi:hypothetical protein
MKFPKWEFYVLCSFASREKYTLRKFTLLSQEGAEGF